MGRKSGFWEAIVRFCSDKEPTTSPCHKSHEVFQPKQGRDFNLPSSRISEMMKSNSLDNAQTQSLLGVVNGILDESIERNNGKIPDRVAHLLRKLMQEIEQISTQAQHIRNQNNLIKAHEEKYQSRIGVPETLATEKNEKNQKDIIKIEERKEQEQQDLARLMKEKEDSHLMIAKLKEEIELINKSHQQRCLQLETMIMKAKDELEEKKKELVEKEKEVNFLLVESKKRTKELEKFSELRIQNWKKKESLCQNFVGFQLQALQDLRLMADSIKKEVISTKLIWSEEHTTLKKKCRELAGLAEAYDAVFAENQRMYNELQELKGNIRVYCRIRPFLSGGNGKSTIAEYIGENGELLIVNPSKQGKDGRRTFKFNKVFGPAAAQEEVYLDTQPLIRSVLDGFNVCIFAYGQTGSGKTYTMSGPDSLSKETWGVNYRALNDLFHISQARRNIYMYEIDVQMVEIYNEQVRDLLSNNGPPKKLGIRISSQSNGLSVPDSNLRPVNSTSDVLELMQYGQTNRATSATACNERSSRSHSVLTVHVRGVDLKTRTSLHGCLHLIDLAGSERIDRSEVTGDRLKEAQHINRSLSALGDVISALSLKNTHVPYRNSKLTQLLQSSLGGHAKTLMFVQINPDPESYSETLSTLKFAERVSGVELGAARSNKEGKDASELMEQVSSLKESITRKDEEIEQLHFLKELRSQSTNSNSEKNGSNLSPSASSSSISHLGGDLEEKSSNISNESPDGPRSPGSDVSGIDKAIDSTNVKVPSKLSRPLPQKARLAALSQPKLKDPRKTPLSPRSVTGPGSTPSARSGKRWQ